MIYGLRPRLVVRDDPTRHAGKGSRTRSALAFHGWQTMDDAQRLALIEQTLAGVTNENLSDG
jgi:hypothetical protein